MTKDKGVPAAAAPSTAPAWLDDFRQRLRSDIAEDLERTRAELAALLLCDRERNSPYQSHKSGVKETVSDMSVASVALPRKSLPAEKRRTVYPLHAAAVRQAEEASEKRQRSVRARETTKTLAPIRRSGYSRIELENEDLCESSSLQAPFGEPAQTRATWILDLVESPRFEMAMSGLILLNCLLIGLETQAASQLTDNSSISIRFELAETFFCAAFVIELTLRIYVYGCAVFFCGEGLLWNWYDLVVVALQVLDVVTTVFHVEMSGADFSVLRMLRLVRIVRAFRIVRMLDDLRSLVNSIMGSMHSLCWTLVLILGVIYVFAVVFTQVVASSNHLNRDDTEKLHEYYGSLSATIQTLFQCVTSGVDWRLANQPLADISPVLSWLFNFYIASVFFALMNVVTGVFVERVSQVAQEDKDDYLAQRILEGLHLGADESEITFERFQESIQTASMLEYFKAINLDPREALMLFRLLDEEETGRVNVVEFVSGCLNLRGPAKSLTLQLHVRDTAAKLEALLEMFGSHYGNA